MSTYAMIDNHTGYVWGAQEASTPVEACRKMDEALGERDRIYDEVSRHVLERSTETGYFVHRAPDGWTCDDGQDPDLIDEVDAMPFVTAVAVKYDR